MSAQKKKSASERSQPRSKKPHLSPEKEREIVAKVNEFAEPLCESEGMELVHTEYQREARGRILRLYIDKPGGVTLDDCVSISRQVSDMLDVAIETRGTYNLEVSSPGSDRPLGKSRDFERFSGNLVKIKTSRPIEGKKAFRGILEGISDGMVTVVINGEKTAIPFQEITRARLVNYNGEKGC